MCGEPLIHQTVSGAEHIALRLCGTAVYYASGVPLVLFHIALVLRVCNVWCRYLAHKAWRPSRAFSGFARNFGMGKVQCVRVVNWALRRIAEWVLQERAHSARFVPRRLTAQHVKAVCYLKYTLMSVHNRKKRRKFGASVDLLGNTDRFAMRGAS